MTSPTIMKARKFKSTRIHLKPCCKESLKLIKIHLNLLELCQIGTMGGQFTVLFSRNFIQFFINLSINDWDLFAEMVGGCGIIKRKKCIDICHIEQVQHSKRNSVDRNLILFWQQMEKVFKK